MSKTGKSIVLLSDQLDGGAAAAANRLAFSLAGLNMPVARWFYAPDSPAEVPYTQASLESHRKRPPLERLLRNLCPPLARRMRKRRHESALLARLDRELPTVLNLHNLHASALTHDSLRLLPPALPLVWTMHDAWPFAPAAYEWSEQTSDTRVTQGEDGPNIKAARARRVMFFEARADTVLISPSQWLAAEARRMLGEKVRVEVIPYGVPIDLFRPMPSAAARAELGLPIDRCWLGFAAASFDARKGGDVFLAAVRQLANRHFGLVVWGDDAHWPWPTGVEIRRFGFIADHARMRSLYSACDLFVCPSRLDNLPNTVLESFACGTPVVGSAVGGIPEMVRPGETGWLYAGNQPDACAAALCSAILERTAWPRYRERCRRLAETEYDPSRQAQAYSRLFAELPQPSS
jgi:glycosyltransferase involved in cell wall biosynthesis